MQFLEQLQRWVRNFFAISSTEANAFLLLFPLMTIFLLLMPFYPEFFPATSDDTKEDTEQLQNYIAELNKSKSKITEENQEDKRLISAIDPNTADFDVMVIIGFDTVSAARIINYRNAGGSFQHREDLLKIYDLDPELYLKIENRIDLPHKIKKAQTQVVESAAKNYAEVPVSETKSNKTQTFDINECDSLMLRRIKGIGPVLSSRIVRYREMVGGFIDTTQYKEVYGLKKDVLEQLFTYAVIQDDYIPKKINVNTASLEDLAGHPYLSWKLAKAIVAYRNQHGHYKELNDLNKIKIFNANTFDKIAPYLSL